MNATPGRAKIAKGKREARGIRSLEMPPEMLNSNLGEQIYICLKQKKLIMTWRLSNQEVRLVHDTTYRKRILETLELEEFLWNNMKNVKCHNCKKCFVQILALNPHQI